MVGRVTGWDHHFVSQDKNFIPCYSLSVSNGMTRPSSEMIDMSRNCRVDREFNYSAELCISSPDTIDHLLHLLKLTNMYFIGRTT